MRNFRYEDSYVEVVTFLSIYLKWLELLCQLLTTVGAHTDGCAHTFPHMHTRRNTQNPHTERNAALSVELISCLIICQFSYSSISSGHMALLWSGSCVCFCMSAFWYGNWSTVRLNWDLIKTTAAERIVNSPLTLSPTRQADQINSIRSINSTDACSKNPRIQDLQLLFCLCPLQPHNTLQHTFSDLTPLLPE